MATGTRFEDGRLIVTRQYDVPRELVFQASVETSKVRQWWGCADAEMLVTVDFAEVEGGALVTLVHDGIPDMRVQRDVELRDVIRAGSLKAGNLHLNRGDLQRLALPEIDWSEPICSQCPTGVQSWSAAQPPTSPHKEFFPACQRLTHRQRPHKQ